MYCTWGSITLDIAHINSFSESGGPAYAEHALIGRKPKLQCTGDELRRLEVGINLHFMRSGTSDRSEPQQLISQLTEAVSSHKPLPFSWANGVYEGLFVGETVSLSREMTDSQGNLLSATYTLTLKEFVDNNESAKEAPAIVSGTSGTPSNAQKAESVAKVSGNAPAQATATTAVQIVRQGA